jgi:hypothetical protein
MKTIVFLAPLALSAVAMAQLNKTGETPVQRPSQSVERGRLGTQSPLPPASVTIEGMLVDGGCQYRSSRNLKRPPEPLSASAPAGGAQPSSTNAGPSSAKGITVDAQTLESERADVMPHQAPDMRSRQSDPTCAISADIHGYAILLDSGRLMNLDGGGNTYAAQAMQTFPAGRAMLNGIGPAVKPRVKVTGRPYGDTFIVQKLEVE